MSIGVGDIVYIKNDTYEEQKYYVKNIKNKQATVMAICPSKKTFKEKIQNLQKTNLTLEEAQEEWSKRHEYTGI